MSNNICVICDINCTQGTKCTSSGAGKCDLGGCSDGYGISSTGDTCSLCAPNCSICLNAGAG